MAKRIDYSNMIGKRFGLLTVLSKSEKKGKHGPYFLCRCDCGREKVILGYCLVRGMTKSCGCRRGANPIESYNDLIGRQYGKLTVIKYAGFVPNHKSKGYSESAYLCHCSCGNNVIIPREQLLADKRRSCGHCFRITRKGDYYKYSFPDGKSFIFDATDYDIIVQKKWYISPQNYVLSSDEGKGIRLGRWLLKPPDGFVVGHRNGDPLDNRRENLRIATAADNNRNSSLQKNNTTGYKGVRYNAGKYETTVYVDNKGIYIGRYNTAYEAARAYDKAARFYFGEFACLNFPTEGEQSCFRNQPKEELKTATA